MIRTKLFQKYFILAFSLIVFFVFFGFYFNSFLMRMMVPAPTMAPPVFFAKIVDRINPKDKVKALEELNSWHKDGPQIQLILLNEKGTALYPSNYQIPFNWGDVEKPIHPYDFTSIRVKSDPPPMPLHMIPGGPMGSPGRKFDAQSLLVKLDDKENLFLFIPPMGPPPMSDKKRPPVPFIGLISLIISLFLGVGFAISIIYYSVKNSVGSIDGVIQELRKGNLKARLPINRKDEFGHAMMRFNYMADEIEKLVLGLKAAEQSRTKLLQELAHDLRTPIASLKNLIETLDSEHSKITPETRKELMGLSLKEIDYFERLVEDLLFLARVGEPTYQFNLQNIDLTDIVADEAETCLLRYEFKNKNIALDFVNRDQKVKMQGEVHLIRRLLRNALENAFSFAKNKITVQINRNQDGKILILIEDDGPGLSEEGLEAFGQRRISRKVETNLTGRLSVGLGSVVMKRICEAHRGQIAIANKLSSDGKILGARVTIVLPEN